LIVDADCLAASVGFLLKLKADFHLDDAVSDCLRLDDDLSSRLVGPATASMSYLIGSGPQRSSWSVSGGSTTKLSC
jgi:hypothetical protein